MNQILISNLNILTSIGNLDQEKNYRQSLLISLKLTTLELKIPPQLDYAEICKRIETYVLKQHFIWIETLAEELCALLFETYPDIITINCILKKPQAIPNADYAGLEITRERSPKK